jgi:hypothetical protein
MRYTTEFNEGRSDNLFITNHSTEQTMQLRNGNHLQLNRNNAIEFGVEVKQHLMDYSNLFGMYTNTFGDTTQAFSVQKSVDATRIASYGNYMVSFPEIVDVTIGVRGEYFSYNQSFHISPRAAVTFHLSDITEVTAATGIYYQSLPFFILSQSDANKKLKDLFAVHYILGLTHLLTEDTKFTAEIFQKEYDHFPMDPQQPSFFSLDEIFYGRPYFFKQEALTNQGQAYARGVELMVQKKLAKDFYGLVSAAWFTARYRGLDGTWRDRVFNNRMIFSAEGGYKPNNEWEFSLRWIYAGGTPYTPFNIQASKAIDRAVYDESQVNTGQQKDYHALNVRCDRRFNFSNSNLILYVSIWNAYDRKNVATQYWNEFTNEPAVQYQWGLLPIIGMEYEF